MQWDYCTDFWIFVQHESSLVREQLLSAFLPDDICPLGAQLSTETLGQIYQFGLKDNEPLDVVTCTAFFLLSPTPPKKKKKFKHMY